MSEKKRTATEQAGLNFKIIIIAVVCFCLLAGLTVFLMNSKGEKAASIVTPMQSPQTPNRGAATNGPSDKYRETVQQGNEARRIEAEQTGQSTIPTILAQNNTKDTNWERGKPYEAPAPPPPGPAAGEYQGQQAHDDRYRAKMEVINHLLREEWGDIPNQNVILAKQTDVAGQDGSSIPTTGQQQSSAISQTSDKAPVDALIGKGMLCYANIVSPINTDNQGARIMGELIHCQGKSIDFSGAKVFGTYERHDETFAVKFDLMHHAGKGYPINALALDEKTSSGVLSGEVDKHIFSRYWVPFLTEFAAGWGAAASRSNTTVTVSLAGTSSTQGELSTSDQLLVAGGQAAKTTNQIVQDALKGKEITVKQAGNTMIGVVFLDDVFAQP